MLCHSIVCLLHHAVYYNSLSAQLPKTGICLLELSIMDVHDNSGRLGLGCICCISWLRWHEIYSNGVKLDGFSLLTDLASS
jgi:hypothetical protein